jgi:hypothetical protein
MARWIVDSKASRCMYGEAANDQSVLSVHTERRRRKTIAFKMLTCFVGIKIGRAIYTSSNGLGRLGRKTPSGAMVPLVVPPNSCL